MNETALQAPPVYMETPWSQALEVMPMKNLIAHVSDMQEVYKSLMKDGEHYGVIPGTNKPTLFKAGAEKLCFAFRLAPEFEIIETNYEAGHREYRITCRIHNINNGLFLGSGVGSASTMESKYRYRNSGRVCPDCGKETIKRSKEEYGGGWYCFTKIGGCGQKWKAGDSAIENQQPGQQEHSDPADYYNTILKMSKKRAMVDAVLTVTAASDIFTQDVEDMVKAAKKAEPVEAQAVEKGPGTVGSDEIATDYLEKVFAITNISDLNAVAKEIAMDTTIDPPERVKLNLKVNEKRVEISSG